MSNVLLTIDIMDHSIQPFSIPAMRGFVPEKCRPWIIVLFVIIFQQTGGVYLASLGQMVGSLSLMREDILMAGYASLVGMSLTFTIMFRLKFRFSSKTSLLTCAIVLIVCNIVSMYTRSVPILIVTCFIAGVFRMWGTFECNSTIQLWLTPKRDLSIFFCFIYLLVQGSIQVSGLATTYVVFLSQWKYMHWLIVGILGFLIVAVLILFRNCSSMRKLPLYGIDWFGALLWALIMFSIIFVCNYGEHYDWFHSPYIRMASVGAVVMIVLNVWRASFIRHPFIENKTWRYEAVYVTFLLYFVVDVLLAPSHFLEAIYTGSILGYDSLNDVSLNWVALLGIVLASLFSYKTFALRKWSYKRMTIIAFSTIVLSLMISYFTIDYNQSKISLLLPLFLRSFGYVIIAICFITALSKVPFTNFFQAVSIQAFASAAVGGVFGASVVEHLFSILVKKNAMLLSANIDNVNTSIRHIPLNNLYGAVQQHAVLVSMKEVYGWLILVGMSSIIIFMLKESSLNPKSAIHPTYRNIRRFVKHQLRIDLK